MGEPVLKEKKYVSGMIGRLVVLILLVAISCLFMIWTGIHRLSDPDPVVKIMAAVPVSIGIILLLMAGMVAYGCYGQAITLNPVSITYQRGKTRTTLLWKDLRELNIRHFPSRKITIYRTASVGNGKDSFEFADIVFADFHFLVDILKTARESSKSGEFKI